MAGNNRAKSQFIINDQPTSPSGNWLGYFHNTDPTTISPDCLTWPSQNCFIPNKDKIVPRKGKTTLGNDTTHNWPTIGHKKRFSTMSGTVVEVKALLSDDPNLKDIIKVLVPVYDIGVTTGAYQWVQITENVNPFNRAVGKLGMRPHYYMDEYFDTNLNPSLSLNLPRLVIVNGTTQVLNWTGGIAPIISIIPNTSISTISGVLWSELGFVSPANGGSGNIIINGVAYAITGGWSTSTLTLTNTTGISVNDIAVSQIQSDTVTIPFDHVRQNKNYLFYGNWGSRKYFQSNGFNRDPSEEITSSFATQDDLIITNNSQYSGTGSHVYKVTIDSVVQPPVSDYGASTGDTAGDNARFIGDHTGLNRDTYELVVDVGGTDVVFFLNGVNTSTFSMASATSSSPHFLANGISVYFLNATGVTHLQGTGFFYTIGGQDTFQYQIDNNTPTATFVPITQAAQSLGSGIEIKFIKATGHTIGNYWNITVNQKIEKAWINFYYTLPVRKPGEGYVYQLPSNFWTQEVQEEQMYIQGAYGEWGFVTTQLSADLQSESVSYTPLKQVSTAKAIYPYMIGHFENDLAFITENKKFEMIGRQALLQLPQIGYLSQPVELDFIAASFVNGSMEYFDKRMYITSPDESVMLVFDNQSGNKYWQPPQVYAENGILSIFNNTLISHSNLTNKTFNLFTGTDDDGGAYTVRARTAYNSFGNRWAKKFSNKTFTEGYVSGNPPLVLTTLLGVNGCGGILPHVVQPIVCVTKNKAPLGEGALASHPFGSDMVSANSHFNEINANIGELSYYFVAFEFSCSTKNHTYSILTMAVNKVISNENNQEFIPQEIISRD